MRHALIRQAGLGLRSSDCVGIFRRRNGDCSSDERRRVVGRREARRLVADCRRAVRLLGVVVVAVVVVVTLLASGSVRFDEFGSEGAEERPHGWNGHGDEDDPFFDFSP